MDQTTPPSNPTMATLRVTNLPGLTSEADLQALFSSYGLIQQVRLVPAQPYRSTQGQGYFDLKSDDVDRAVAEVDGLLFKGAIIRVSQVSHVPSLPEIRKDDPKPPPDAAPSSVRTGNQYEVTTVEKAVSPEGSTGDWFRYVLSSGRSQITGLHRGTRDEVMEYATACAELVNSRSTGGKSPRTYAPIKKK